MSRTALPVLALAAAYLLAVATPTLAQVGPNNQHGPPQQDPDEAAKRKKRDQDFGSGPNLPKVRNAGPCPFVRVLYDAARYIEFKDGRESASAVGFTGEIQNVASSCIYKARDPIKLQSHVQFDFGRGPQAVGRTHVYRYWVAVTDRNRAVLDKQWFSLPVTFPPNTDRVAVIEQLGQITIPRANATVSGANFEVLVGFDVTAQMAAFNRDGKRFRENAGQSTTQAAAPTPRSQ